MKIEFIICTNDELLYSNCTHFINQLIIPKGCTIDIMKLTNQRSITSAYNNAIKASTAKYKVYLHQDTFINNVNFISELIAIFTSDSAIGIIGMIGSKTIPPNGVWWKGETIGKVYGSPKGRMELMSFSNPAVLEEVEAVDGLLIATQYDIPWNEEFQGWHYYDLSQCAEFRKYGYKVVIPHQDEPWVTHDCGKVNVSNGYDENRKLFISTYLK